MEIRKILPEGQRLDDTVLARATMSMNATLRRKQALSAYEMHTARRLDTGTNLKLSDAKLRQSQLEARKPITQAKPQPVIKPGDTVTPVSAQEKHTVRDMYLVTNSQQDSVKVQKIIHPLSQHPTKMMAKEYITNPKNLRIIHSSPVVPVTVPQVPDPPVPAPVIDEWNPIRRDTSLDEDSDDDDDEDVHRNNHPAEPEIDGTFCF